VQAAGEFAAAVKEYKNKGATNKGTVPAAEALFKRASATLESAQRLAKEVHELFF
jgi:hypothetical protein